MQDGENAFPYNVALRGSFMPEHIEPGEPARDIFRGQKFSISLGCMIGALLCYGSIPVFIRYFTSYLDAWTVNGVRYAIGALIWLPSVLYLLPRVEGGRNVWKDALVPASVNLCGQIGWGLGPYYNEASIIAFVIRTSFFFTIVFGFIVLPEERKLSKMSFFWWGGALCVSGLVFMYCEGITGSKGTSVAGLTILVLTALFWGAYGVSIRKFMAPYPARLSFGVISLYTSAGLLPFMFTLGDYRALASVEARILGLVAISAILGIAIAHVLMYRAIHGFGPVVTSGSSLSTPFLTYTLAMLILGERMSQMQWTAGSLLIGGGVFLVLAKSHVRTP